MLRTTQVLLSALFVLSLQPLSVAAAPPAPSPVAAFADPPAAGDATLTVAEATKLLPPAVFFRGQSAPVQTRNSGGIRFADGAYVLVTLVDNSGYSTAVQQKYQAYFITETPIDINGHTLAPGAYGSGFLGGHFTVMDIGGHDLFTVDAAHDAAYKRPTPLQVVAETTPSHFRLYQGRDYVVISRPETK